jgi:hypothetical protein
MLTPADEEFGRRFRDKRNVLGAAVQLCTLPWLGFAPDDVPAAPAAAVARLSERLGIPVGELRGWSAARRSCCSGWRASTCRRPALSARAWCSSWSASRPPGSGARKETWQRLEPALTGFLRAELDGMLVPDPLLGRTRLAWLETGPVSSTPVAAKGELLNDNHRSVVSTPGTRADVGGGG